MRVCNEELHEIFLCVFIKIIKGFMKNLRKCAISLLACNVIYEKR